jgi:hypothetical protein
MDLTFSYRRIKYFEAVFPFVFFNVVASEARGRQHTGRGQRRAAGRGGARVEMKIQRVLLCV